MFSRKRKHYAIDHSKVIYRIDNRDGQRVEIPSEIVLKKHLLLVLSIIACIYTIIGWYMGSTSWVWKNWAAHVVLAASVASTIIGVCASVKMNRCLLILYSIIGSIEFSFKIVFIILLQRKKSSVARHCKTYAIQPSECYGWRLDDLQLTNSIVFHIISSISLFALIIFSFQLIVYVSKRNRELRARHIFGQTGRSTADTTATTASQLRPGESELTVFSLFSRSEPAYGTFKRLFTRKKIVNNTFVSSL